jgi:hypothetical protein
MPDTARRLYPTAAVGNRHAETQNPKHEILNKLQNRNSESKMTNENEKSSAKGSCVIERSHQLWSAKSWA